MSRQMKFCLLFGLVAIVWGLVAIYSLPHDREVKSLSIFIFKLVPFFFAAFAIALFDASWIERCKLVFPILAVGFLIFFCVFIPVIFFHLQKSGRVYYFFLLMVPYIILLLSLAFRFGGASFGNSLRLSLGLLFLMISGIEDLGYITTSLLLDPTFNGVPQIWDWASHIKVRLGHFPTKYEAYWFIAFHVALAFFIFFYPFKILSRFKKFLGVE